MLAELAGLAVDRARCPRSPRLSPRKTPRKARIRDDFCRQPKVRLPTAIADHGVQLKKFAQTERSFLRHPRLAQTSEIGGFEQGADLRHPEICRRPSGGRCLKNDRRRSASGLRRVRRRRVRSRLSGHRRRRGGVNDRECRISAARLFEPEDRLVDARLQQMHGPNPDDTNCRSSGSRGLRRMACSTSGITSSIDPV